METRAHVGRHPLHPILVHFPIAFWVGAFIVDLVASAGGMPHEFGYYLALAGCVGAGLAAIPGAIDLFASVLPKWGPRVRRLAIAHAALNASALVAWIANVVARPSDYAMSTGAWIAGAVGLGLVAVGGYLGGRMVFEFRVGVSDEHVRDVVGPVDVDSTRRERRDARRRTA